MSYEASYVKARKKAVKQLKNSNAQQLEIETRKMEERIRALKEQMFKEKEEREKQGGTRWASGKSGPLNSHAQDVLKKKNLKAEKAPRKIKILGDEPLQSYRKKATPRAQQGDNFGASGCGQCERMKATLVCIECDEKYCVSCFMSFHQKGALKKHSTQTLEEYEADQQLVEKESYSKPVFSPSTNTPRITNHEQARSPQMGDTTGQPGGALLQGSYDEQESAQSFADALMAWRNSGKEEKLRTNPTDTKGSSRDSSTTPEPSKHQEVKLNFGPNKSLSYLDRMLLKKHHGDPNFTSPQTPPKGTKREGSELSPNKNNASNSPRFDDQLGMNYREIFQSLGASSNRKNTQENNVPPSTSVIAIEEVNDDDLSGEETVACIVEEEDSYPHPQARPVSRSGGVSIMCMTPMGRFEADSDALVLEDVSPVSMNSPASEQAEPLSRLSVRGANSRVGQKSQRQDQTGGSTGRIWSPQPRHVGLSEFFLAGVQGESPSGRVSRVKDASFDLTSVKPDKLSKSLLSQNVWKPLESVFASDDSNNRQEQRQEEHSGSEGRVESPRPIIPLLREPGLSAKNGDRPDSQSSTIVTSAVNDSQFGHDTQIHDFGIVDFLKAQPYMPKGYEEYSQVHRVSTVSPLTLSPNPPSFHWSDDSDDDILAQICNQVTQEDQKADQDEDDRATLTDLAWELASTTGRLTQCELDEEEEEDEEEFEEDSIENNDSGSGLSSSEEDISATDTYSASVNKTNEKDENTLAEEEVHALK
ncbi:hypothetical protein ACROYT_G029422 [Oculina patagonica]